MSKTLKKIAIDLTPVIPGGHNGGAKVYVLELIRELAELYPEITYLLLLKKEAFAELNRLACDNILLVSMDDDSSRFEHERATRYQARSYPRRIWDRLKRELASRGWMIQQPKWVEPCSLRKMDVDLLFCPFTDPTYYEPGIPVVSTIHDLQYKTYPQFFTEADVRHRDAVFIRTVERSTALAAVSEYARASAMSHGGISSECIRTIYHRLANRMVECTDDQVLTELGLTSAEYLIYPANFWIHKNHEVLLTAFSLALRQGLPSKMKLVLTGASSSRQEWLKDAVLGLGIQGRVVFPGYVTDDQLGALIQKSAGMVFPSLYEGFGIPVIEAMGAGIPVACSNAGSLPEVAGEAALLFDPRSPEDLATAMIRLTTDQALRCQLVEEGNRRAVQFADSKVMAREHMSLFHAAMDLQASRYQVVGRYDDGWLGPKLWVQAGASEGQRQLKFVFSTEGWMPGQWAKLSLHLDGALVDTYEIQKGTTRKIKVTLDARSHLIEWRFMPLHIPSDYGLGNDHRLLSLMLKACWLMVEGQDEADLLKPNRPLETTHAIVN